MMQSTAGLRYDLRLLAGRRGAEIVFLVTKLLECYILN